MMMAWLTLVRISAVAEGMYFCSTHSAQVSKMRMVDSLSATVILLARLEECNPDASNIVTTYAEVGEEWMILSHSSLESGGRSSSSSDS